VLPWVSLPRTAAFPFVPHIMPLRSMMVVTLPSRLMCVKVMIVMTRARMPIHGFSWAAGEGAAKKDTGHKRENKSHSNLSSVAHSLC
jgi:hypothetical protein